MIIEATEDPGFGLLPSHSETMLQAFLEKKCNISAKIFNELSQNDKEQLQRLFYDKFPDKDKLSIAISRYNNKISVTKESNIESSIQRKKDVKHLMEYIKDEQVKLENLNKRKVISKLEVE